MRFEHRFEITFGDADPAGIAYYPRILDFCHRAFERFFADAVGEPYVKTFLEKNIGFPTVALESEFRAPMRFGDSMTVFVSIDKVTERSVTYRYEFERSDGTSCATVRNTTVAVDRVTFRSVPVPQRYTSVFEKYLTESDRLKS